MEYIKARLKEPSTWRGLILVFIAFSAYQFTSDQATAILELGMALSGGIGATTPDNHHES